MWHAHARSDIIPQPAPRTHTHTPNPRPAHTLTHTAAATRISQAKGVWCCSTASSKQGQHASNTHGTHHSSIHCAATGNRTPVSRVTGGDNCHYTIATQMRGGDREQTLNHGPTARAHSCTLRPATCCTHMWHAHARSDISPADPPLARTSHTHPNPRPRTDTLTHTAAATRISQAKGVWCCSLPPLASSDLGLFLSVTFESLNCVVIQLGPTCLCSASLA